MKPLLLILFLLPSLAFAGTIELTFTDNSDNEDAFYIERRVSGTAEFTVIGTVVPDDPSTYDIRRTYYDRTAISRVAYEYRVNAGNSVGKSGYTNTAEGMASGSPKDPSNAIAVEFTEPQPSANGITQ